MLALPPPLAEECDLPRFHFNVFDGITSIDQDGTELPDIHSARQEALILAGAMIEDSAKRNELGEDWRLEVTDDAGLLLFRLDFTMAESAAAKTALKAEPYSSSA